MRRNLIGPRTKTDWTLGVGWTLGSGQRGDTKAMPNANERIGKKPDKLLYLSLVLFLFDKGHECCQSIK